MFSRLLPQAANLLLPSATTPHVGSIDVDLALNHRNLREAGYATIQKLLLRRGYEHDVRQPFIFHRTVVVKGNPIKVELDFLAGEYEGTGPKHRTQLVQEGRARKARGCDLAFDLYVEAEIEGELPEGGRDQARIRVSSVVAFLVMKGMALHDRLKEKDAWDVYFTLTNYPGGLDALVQEFRPHLGHELVKEGLRKIAEKFASPEHVGPRFVADFDEIDDPDERALRTRDAFERVRYLIAALGMQ
ncbi:MAG: nucleotidyl transferase AbiEii/AbiGii toxin family protein [Acidobacteriia bacterium]|nr:nucleotidyl transferase AbiEii/AbiGii toxin family protein [Terriglobia bacterium]